MLEAKPSTQSRIACLDFNLQKTKMQLGIQDLVTDPRDLEKICQREADVTKERIEKLLKAGSNVVLTTKGIPDDFMLGEMDRALHDALCIVKRTLESNTVVASAGAVEAALSVYLEYLATTLGSREQLAIAVLAVNAAKDVTDLVAKLRSYHHTAQTKAGLRYGFGPGKGFRTTWKLGLLSLQ